MAKNSMTQIKTSMKKDFPATSKSMVQKAHPAKKLARGEVSNEVGRPPKR